MTSKYRNLWIIPVVLLTVLLLAPQSYGAGLFQNFFKSLSGTSKPKAKDIPASQDAFTWKKYCERGREWAEEKLLANYEKYGEHSPEWDAKAKQYLAKYARYKFSYNDSIILKELQEIGEELMESGCSDPHILSVQGDLYYQLDDIKKALPLVRKNLPLLEASQYPRIYLYYAARSLQRIYEQAPRFVRESGALGRKKMKYLGQAAADPDFANGNQRYYMEEAVLEWGWYSDMPDGGWLMVQEMDKTPGVDPWIDLMIKGFYRIRKAWEARGCDWADKVTEAGWEKFGKEMSRARKSLTEADALHPEFPEAATWLISINMATSAGRGERHWFDRAVSAQLDYRPAYVNLLWSLRPRWRGSHNAMYQFGIECLNTGRFDTEVPRMFLKVLWDIGSELDNWKDAYRSTGTYGKLQVLFEGMLNDPSRARWHDYWKSAYAMTAWAAGRYGDSRKLFDELGDNVYMPIFAEFNTKSGVVFKEIY